MEEHNVFNNVQQHHISIYKKIIVFNNVILKLDMLFNHLIMHVMINVIGINKIQ